MQNDVVRVLRRFSPAGAAANRGRPQGCRSRTEIPNGRLRRQRKKAPRKSRGAMADRIRSFATLLV